MFSFASVKKLQWFILFVIIKIIFASKKNSPLKKSLLLRIATWIVIIILKKPFIRFDFLSAILLHFLPNFFSTFSITITWRSYKVLKQQIESTVFHSHTWFYLELTVIAYYPLGVQRGYCCQSIPSEGYDINGSHIKLFISWDYIFKPHGEYKCLLHPLASWWCTQPCLKQ